jgi:cytoskeleton protein RodZ
LAGFGEKLRRERELRGISLDQIAAATKISTRMLKALEAEKFDLLPGGIFNKGFIRSYAKFLGIDEEQAVADYVAATGPEEPINNLPQIADIPERPPRQLDEEGTISWTTILALVVLVAIGYGGWTYHNHRKAQTESRATTAPVAAISTPPVEAPPAERKLQTAEVTTPKPPATAPLESTPAKGAPPSTASPAALKTDATEPAPKPSVDLVIRTNEESWVQAVADGKTIFSETLPASSEKHVTALRRITLTVGNAGGVEVTYNGATLPDIGGPGKVRTIVFSPAKFEFQSEHQ